MYPFAGKFFFYFLNFILSPLLSFDPPAPFLLSPYLSLFYEVSGGGVL